jgi:hypothetical protein
LRKSRSWALSLADVAAGFGVVLASCTCAAAGPARSTTTERAEIDGFTWVLLKRIEIRPSTTPRR